jgi:hypothetical protein
VEGNLIKVSGWVRVRVRVRDKVRVRVRVRISSRRQTLILIV